MFYDIIPALWEFAAPMGTQKLCTAIKLNRRRVPEGENMVLGGERRTIFLKYKEKNPYTWKDSELYFWQTEENKRSSR